MKKIFSKEQLKTKMDCPTEVIQTIEEIITILDENYGENREIDKELGGYIVILENLKEVYELRKNRLQGLIAEYIDIIECSEGVNWTSSLFLLSSDVAIIVVTTEELSKLLLE